MIHLNTTRILVPFDFSSTSKKALHHAAMLVQKSKGELQLLYIKKPKSLVPIGLSTSELREMATEADNYKKAMELTAEEIRQNYQIKVKALVNQGRTISGILSVAEKNQVGMIVMGTEGSDSVSNLFSGSNSYKVVSRSEIPVITVRSESKKKALAAILVPVDLSEHTRQKVVMAIQMAKAFQARIHVAGFLPKADKEAASKLNVIMHQIETRLKEERLEFSTSIEITDRPAARTIALARAKKSDLIITMTDQGPSGSLYSKSYDQELVEESGVPVMSVPPELHEENIRPASIGGLW